MSLEDASENLSRRVGCAIKPSDIMGLTFKENARMISRLADLSDAQLVDSLKGLVARGRAVTAQVLVHLAEVEHRQLHLAAAYASMHAYTTATSASATAKRMTESTPPGPPVRSRPSLTWSPMGACT